MMAAEVKVFWQNEKEIAVANKNKREKIKVIYGERRDKGFVDIRIYKILDDKLSATSKGVAIPIEEAMEIAKKILDLQEK